MSSKPDTYLSIKIGGTLPSHKLKDFIADISDLTKIDAKKIREVLTHKVVHVEDHLCVFGTWSLDFSQEHFFIASEHHEPDEEPDLQLLKDFCTANDLTYCTYFFSNAMGHCLCDTKNSLIDTNESFSPVVSSADILILLSVIKKVNLEDAAKISSKIPPESARSIFSKNLLRCDTRELAIIKSFEELIPEVSEPPPFIIKSNSNDKRVPKKQNQKQKETN